MMNTIPIRKLVQRNCAMKLSLAAALHRKNIHHLISQQKKIASSLENLSRSFSSYNNNNNTNILRSKYSCIDAKKTTVCLAASTSHGLSCPTLDWKDYRMGLTQRRFYTNKNILSLHKRGLWKDRFPESSLEFERIIASDVPQTMYAGFDPTADSLHIGNLLVIIALLHCQRAGHQPIVLLGGFTSTVGDPSGRTTSRSLLLQEQADTNLQAIQRSITNVFGNHDRLFWDHKQEQKLTRPIIVNNSSWLCRVSQQELMSVLHHISVRDLLKSSFIRDRLNQDTESSKLTAKELMYQVYQAYDWLHLYDAHDCTIQIGGSDQMANMWLGHDLIRATRNNVCLTGLTTPILTTVTGEKLGKSAGNSLWLSHNNTSYFDFYQYFFRIKDQEVEQFLKLLTFLPLSEITQLMENHKKNPVEQQAQKKLAECVTLLVHGEYGLAAARHSTDILYHNKGSSLLLLSEPELLQLFSGQQTQLSLEPATTVLDAAMKAKCFKFERDAEGVIRNGGFRINQTQVQDPYMVLIPDAHILPSGYSLLRVGKKNYTLVAWTQ